MALNPMMASQMYSAQGGNDMTMVFIVIILFCCSIFCLFIYYYVEEQKEKEKEKGSSECANHTNASTCGEDISCSWDTSTFSCVTATAAVTCSLEQYVSNKTCQPCETFPDGSFRVKSSSTAPANGPDTTCSVKQPCPEDYHVVSGSCVSCPEGKVNSAGSGPPSSDTECKRPFCSNTQKIICVGEGETGTCGERCCCEACPDGLESSIVPIQSPDDATESDTFCVQVGQGATRETVSSSTPLKDLCALGYHVDQNHNCVRCLPSATKTTYTQHDPNGPPTPCEKAPCTGGQRSDPDVPGGGLCRPCIGQETNEGNFRPNDPIYSTCLQCKHDSYIQNGECVRCPTGKTNSLSGGVPFLKTNPNMVGIATCKSPLCENNEKIVCTQTTRAGQVSPPDSSTSHVSDTAGPGNEDLSQPVPGTSPTDVTTDAAAAEATGAETGSEWTCSCSPCGGNLEAAQVHTVHLEDIVPPPGSTSPYEATTCVAECSGAVYMGSVTEASHTISRCGSSPASCSEEDLTTMIDELNTLNETTCPNGPEKNTITALIEDIDTLLLQKPCPQDHRQDTSGGASGTDFCIDCCPGVTECDQIGSYPAGNITNFSNDHQHTEPRSAATTNTVCKKRLCGAGENLEKVGNTINYRCTPCPSTHPMGAPLYSPAGGCSSDGTIDGVESRTCTPGNGQHYVSPSDALPGDVTECRNPNAATCGDLASGQGITCPDNYYPVTSAEDLLKRCQGSTCDSMNVDRDVCCKPNDTCKGGIITQGIVGEISLTDGTFRLQEDVSSEDDDEYNGKNIIIGEWTGSITDYAGNTKRVTVNWDVPQNTRTTAWKQALEGMNYVIVEPPVCGEGYIYDPSKKDVSCEGETCDYGDIDRDKCCIPSIITSLGQKEINKYGHINNPNDCKIEFYEDDGCRGDIMNTITGSGKTHWEPQAHTVDGYGSGSGKDGGDSYRISGPCGKVILYDDDKEAWTGGGSGGGPGGLTSDSIKNGRTLTAATKQSKCMASDKREHASSIWITEGPRSNKHQDNACLDLPGDFESDVCGVRIDALPTYQSSFIISHNGNCAGEDGLKHITDDTTCIDAVKALQGHTILDSSVKTGTNTISSLTKTGDQYSVEVEEKASGNHPFGCYYDKSSAGEKKIFMNTTENSSTNGTTRLNNEFAICKYEIESSRAMDGWSTTGSNEICGATDSAGPGTGPWNTGLHDGTFTSISECEQACEDDTNCDSFSVHPNGLHGEGVQNAAINYVICNGHPVGAESKSTGSNPWRCYKKN